ncbi:unnamed protein product [Rotaria sp. Silwood1]|nr:unnamed protein product [Rotaria sp. Silwood1]
MKIIPIAATSKTFNADISSRLSNTFLKLKRKKSIIPVKRVQLRFVSVFAFATHQCQGKTFDRILIDLIFSPERRRNEVALPYVPISRCKWLVDLVFLRDFPLLSIQIKPTQAQLDGIRVSTRIRNAVRSTNLSNF